MDNVANIIIHEVMHDIYKAHHVENLISREALEYLERNITLSITMTLDKVSTGEIESSEVVEPKGE